MSTGKSKVWVVFLIVPIVLLGGGAAGAFAYRSSQESGAEQAAEKFLRELSGPGPHQAAFALTGRGKAARSEADIMEFEAVLARTGMFDVQDVGCPSIEREANFLNTFTMGLYSVRCNWRGGSGTLMITDEGVVSIAVDGKLYENL